jgi:tRNA dimethylallyltransferase
MSAELLVIVGPTASGKTELAVRLAEVLGGEIVSADSVQVYRHFDIGTSKPSAEERRRAPHHLIDIVEPDEDMDAARWAKLADQAIAEIAGRGRRPIVCGGTFLWVQALLHGLAEAPPADAAVRRRHRERAEREGRAALHAELARVDPVCAARLHPNDLVRVSRALEVFELSGVTLSSWQEQHAFRTERYPARLLGIRHARASLDTRMAARVRAMFAAGWVDEVRALLARGWGATRPMRSVGYRQIAHALMRDELDEPALAEEVYRANRVFGRRQRTWLRDRPVTWLTPEQAFERPPSELRALVGE